MPCFKLLFCQDPARSPIHHGAVWCPVKGSFFSKLGRDFHTFLGGIELPWGKPINQHRCGKQRVSWTIICTWWVFHIYVSLHEGTQIWGHHGISLDNPTILSWEAWGNSNNSMICLKREKSFFWATVMGSRGISKWNDPSWGMPAPASWTWGGGTSIQIAQSETTGTAGGFSKHPTQTESL